MNLIINFSGGIVICFYTKRNRELIRNFRNSRLCHGTNRNVRVRVIFQFFKDVILLVFFIRGKYLVLEWLILVSKVSIGRYVVREVNT